MTISEQPIPTTLGPLVDELKPKHRALIVQLRVGFDRNKARGRYTGLRELQEWSYATTMRMTIPVISRILSGIRFPDYGETCHLWELFTGKPATQKLERLWRQAAAERGSTRNDIDSQIRKVTGEAADLAPRITGGRVRVIGSAWGLRRALAVTTGAASAVFVIVAFVIGRPWLAAAATVPVAIFAGLAVRQGIPAAVALVQLLANIRHIIAHRDRDRDDAD